MLAPPPSSSTGDAGMSVANIFNIPNTDAELAIWSRMHMMWHRSMNVRILAVHHIALPEFVLDPVDLSQGSNFPQNHQTMHNNIDAILGVQGQDLLSIEWSDESARIGWFQSHALLTQLESNALEVFS